MPAARSRSYSLRSGPLAMQSDLLPLGRFKRKAGAWSDEQEGGFETQGRVRSPILKFLIEISPREAVDGIFVESPANGASSLDSVHVRELLALGTMDRARRYPSVYRPCLCRLSLSSLRISLENQLNPALGDYAISCIWRRREWRGLAWC
jgi:hypothetical protein